MSIGIYLRCDNCAEKRHRYYLRGLQPDAEDLLRDEATIDGWRCKVANIRDTERPGWHDYCPECWKAVQARG